jgi:hypothetical protein
MTPATAKSATADKESNTSSSSSEDDSSDSAEETNKKAKTMAMKCATTEGSAEAGGQGMKANKLALMSDPKSEEGKTKEFWSSFRPCTQLSRDVFITALTTIASNDMGYLFNKYVPHNDQQEEAIAEIEGWLAMYSKRGHPIRPLA